MNKSMLMAVLLATALVAIVCTQTVRNRCGSLLPLHPEWRRPGLGPLLGGHPNVVVCLLPPAEVGIPEVQQRAASTLGARRSVAATRTGPVGSLRLSDAHTAKGRPDDSAWNAVNASAQATSTKNALVWGP